LAQRKIRQIHLLLPLGLSLSQTKTSSVLLSSLQSQRAINLLATQLLKILSRRLTNTLRSLSKGARQVLLRSPKHPSARNRSGRHIPSNRPTNTSQALSNKRITTNSSSRIRSNTSSGKRRLTSLLRRPSNISVQIPQAAQPSLSLLRVPSKTLSQSRANTTKRLELSSLLGTKGLLAYDAKRGKASRLFA
jgi:hypothetical protein